MYSPSRANSSVSIRWPASSCSRIWPISSLPRSSSQGTRCSALAFMCASTHILKCHLDSRDCVSLVNGGLFEAFSSKGFKVCAEDDHFVIRLIAFNVSFENLSTGDMCSNLPLDQPLLEIDLIIYVHLSRVGVYSVESKCGFHQVRLEIHRWCTFYNPYSRRPSGW